MGTSRPTSRPAILLLVLQGFAVGVRLDGASAKDEDSFDEAPKGSGATGANGDHNLPNSNTGVAEVEAVDAKSAEKDPKQAGHEF